MKSDETTLSVEQGHELLAKEYHALSSRLTLEIIAFRSISFIWLVLSITGLYSHQLQFVALAVAALFSGLLWKLVATVGEQSRQRLEQALIDYALRDDVTGDLEKIYVEWQHERWRHSRLWNLISIEPFLWIALTLVMIAVRWLMPI